MDKLKPRVAIIEHYVSDCNSCQHFDSHVYEDGACTADNQNWKRLPNTDNKPRIILDSCPLPFYTPNSSLTTQLAEAKERVGTLEDVLSQIGMDLFLRIESEYQGHIDKIIELKLSNQFHPTREQS